MQEPDDKHLVLIGNLVDNDPWHLELWARDDAQAKDSTERWYQAGLGEDVLVHRLSWTKLEALASTRMDTLTVLGEVRP
ncbi:hypothetical protein [Actinoplanes rectilineatus]|uniref:hypothetical protein n=1 Tax=Actinoplanes rectilineatus TaxID=113571 RepID=UPI0005F2F479|nr:hypothetical protein [Actinoplanes rectilineatus]